MLNRITNSTAYQSVIGLFGRTSNPHTTEAPVPSRFKSAAELSTIATILDKLVAKKDMLAKVAEGKGAASNEAATFSVMEHFINLVQAEISRFNATPYQPDILSNYRDMLQLTTNLQNLMVLTPRQEETLNSVLLDKPIIRSTALTVGLYALPVIPVLLLGPGAWAVALGVGGYLAMKPTDEYLTSIKAIDWDTESKELLTDFVEATKKTHAILGKYIECTQPNNNNTPL